MNFPTRLSFLCLLLFALCALCACQPAPPAGPARPADPVAVAAPAPDTSHYLPFTEGVRCFLEDSHGNLWVGSWRQGVARIAAGKFSVYTVADGLSDNQVRSIYEDAAGTIWFECGIGVSKYEGGKVSVVKERQFPSLGNLSSETGELWFKTDPMIGYSNEEGRPGIYNVIGAELVFRPFPVEPKPAESNHYSVTTEPVRTPDGRTWFGTYGAVIGFNGKEFTVLDDEALGRNEANGYLHIRSLLADSKGNLWIGNNWSGVLYYTDGEVTDFTRQHGVGREPLIESIPGLVPPTLSRVFAIEEDAIGNIWFGTVESGVWRWDGEALTNYGVKDGLPCGLVTGIYQRPDGEVLFGGGAPAGVYAFAGERFVRRY